MTAPQSRPRVVTAAFWCWLVASLLLIVGGLLVATVNVPNFYRASGIVTALAGVGVAFLAGRTRGGDHRFRRAAIGLTLAVVVLAALLSVSARLFGGIVHVFTPLAVIPLAAATVLITRPEATAWFESEDTQ